ncbi:MAG: selenide, water dikinase SelD [Planctomycetota bacterium]
MQKKLGRNTIVLLGVGHTNAHVLRMWKMEPLDNAQLVCISNFPIATYSGMMPGVLAGQYDVPDMEIDLVRLCQSAGARLIVGDVTAIDAANREIHFRDRPSLAFDVLSIGVGSRPTFNGVELVTAEGVIEFDELDHSASQLIAIKPMQTYLDRLKQRIETLASPSRPLKISIVGGGIGSIEIAFCLDQRLKTDPAALGMPAGARYEICLVTGAAEIGAGLNDSTRNRVQQVCADRGIAVKTGSRVSRIVDGDNPRLELKDGSELSSDLTIWATSAVAPGLLDRFDFEKDDNGFLITRSTLQLTSHDRILAVGDTGSIENELLPKAGVYAVRQGPVLWDNIRRLVWNRKLTNYAPQRTFLKLINSADGKSIAEYGNRSFSGRWCWWLKDRIDRKFMKMYQDYTPMEMVDVSPVDTEEAMRCLGCGGKIGSQLLSQVLRELEVPPHEDVIIGLDHPDDAAVVRTRDGRVTVTTDFFASPLYDPYVVGRIAMLNSASDCFVMGAQPTSALAIVELPLGHPRAQLQVMRELMAGAVDELKKMGATIVGGHSIEGPRLTAGFTVLGYQLADPKTKGMLEVGDQLILTKPIGSGVLLAAQMQAKLDGRSYLELVDSMLQSNQIALELIQSEDVSAITDVTGFGLGGHLIEMLRASQKSAAINLNDVPLYPGCLELIESGIESTLAPDNQLIVETIDFRCNGVGENRIAPLYDPQTCGGLLLGVKPAAAERVLAKLNDAGFGQSQIIGEVVPNDGDKVFLQLSDSTH